MFVCLKILCAFKLSDRYARALISRTVAARALAGPEEAAPHVSQPRAAQQTQQRLSTAASRVAQQASHVEITAARPAPSFSPLPPPPPPPLTLLLLPPSSSTIPSAHPPPPHPTLLLHILRSPPSSSASSPPSPRTLSLLEPHAPDHGIGGQTIVDRAQDNLDLAPASPSQLV